MLLRKSRHNPVEGTAALKAALRVSATATVIGLAFTTGAAAGTLVEHWDFELNSAWTATTPGEGSPSVTYSNTNAHFMAPSLISWGTAATANGQSSLNVGESNGNFEGMVWTDMGFVPTVTVTHNNWPLQSPSAGGAALLTSAILSDQLTLTPTAPPGSTFSAPQLDFTIKFVETSNLSNSDASGNPDSCTSGGAATGNGCPDIFVLMLPDGAVFEDGLLKQKFEYDMYLYEAQLKLEDLGLLSEEECAEADADPGCIGLTTQENQATDFGAELAIMSMGMIIVPEPGALAVLGLGLVGLGYVRRRRIV